VTSIFDVKAFAAELVKLPLGSSNKDILALRAQASGLIRNALVDIHDAAEKLLLKDGKGTVCAMRLAKAEDAIIATLFEFAARKVFPGNDMPDMAVIAVGGYGRGTLAPGSDIDLLFLTPAKEDERSKRVVEFLLYALWDARQKVGHATRTIDDCIKLAKTDNTILTAMLEARHICGAKYLSDALSTEFRKTIVRTSAKKFVTEKLAERDNRHLKSGESRYAVEPDIKDGKGGLRDLHTLFWIAKFIYDTPTPEELAEKGAFSQAELKRFQKCEDFLWTVRCHLHFIAKRGEDKISFDRQSELAERLGYKGHAGLRHVERFMRHYFLIAKEVGDLTRIFCASLEAKHLKDAPSLARHITNLFTRRTPGVADLGDFSMDLGRLTVGASSVFERDPVNLIRIFKVASDRGIEIHPDALKLIHRSLRLIDDRLRSDPIANRLFVEILTESGDPETVLRMVNEAGVLGRFIPEFGRVVGMMQFNMYHHYTVDEHLLRTVGLLYKIEQGTLSGDHPLSFSLFPTLKSRRALYVAALIHDIGKGRREHHSIVGEQIALSLCPRLGLEPAETETVAWLVRWHLLMSETAQMRDLNDYKTILDFTAIVQSPERLKLLVILTVADTRAVGPGVWNGWKGQLLRTLYAEAEPVITGGHTATTRKERVAEAQDAFFARLPQIDAADRSRIATKHYDAYWLTVSAERQERHEAIIAATSTGEIGTGIKTDRFAAITEITVYAPDHPRLLALIFGACTAANANIVGAQIFTTTDGMALDTILLQREFPEEEDEARRAERVCDMIRKVLRGQVKLRDAIAQVRRPASRAAAFTVEPRVLIDNSSSNKFTVIEINAMDRIGLLHALTDGLFHLNLNIASAHITTFGEKAVDVFYVTDLTGAKVDSPTRIKQIEVGMMRVIAPDEMLAARPAG